MAANEHKSSRIFYFDALRTLAIITVIIFHVYMACKSLVIGEYGIILSYRWIFTDILNTVFGFGVDIFLMLSGALLLGRVWDIKSFLSKRIPRIVIPFIFWVVILSIVMVTISMYYPNWIHTLILSI